MKCPECDGKKFRRDVERAEMVCANCGLVVEEDAMQRGPEWRAFTAEQRAKRARTGAPLKYTRPDRGLTTQIDQYDRDAAGGRIEASRRAQLYRMRKWHRRTSLSTSAERNLAIALTELNRVSTHLGLSESIRESTALLYRKCLDKGLIRGRTIESVVCAVIYAVCRMYGFPRTLEEISSVSEIPKRDIGKTYRLIIHELEMKIPLMSPHTYIPRFIHSLRLSGKTQEKAVELLNEAVGKKLISGRGPIGVVAAVVYIASVICGEERTQKEIAEVAGVTEVTVRNRYRELKKFLGLKIPL
ncbi:transcription initiation factor IIB [Candidatus Micrarchaeota archaeon]|nr:transcription initiation factor IIB [Candidatus Micrarchaeota archaeon]